MHELFHVFQAYNETPETLSRASANLEVEAQVAKVIFIMESYTDPHFSSNYMDLTTNPIYANLLDMASCVGADGYPINESKLSLLRDSFYKSIRDVLRFGETHKKNGVNQYVFDSNRSSYDEIAKNLIYLFQHQ